MASAGKTLVGLFSLAQELNLEAEGVDIGPSPADAQLAQDLALPIEEMDPDRPLLQLPQARGHPQHR